MASGWNLWVWLPCICVVSGCCCKEVYIDILTIIINFPYSTCISSFLAAASLLLCSFLKCFSVFLLLILVFILILQWTYHNSVLSSNARLHVNSIHFLARRAVCYITASR